MKLIPVCLILISVTATALQELPVQPVTQAPRAWRPVEFALDCESAANPYDPDACRLDATVTAPAGTLAVPGFWYQPYARSVEGGRERLTPNGSPGWRIRYLPTEPGPHEIRAVFVEKGEKKVVWSGHFDVAPAGDGLRGLVRVEPQHRQYFTTDDGTCVRPFPLIGMNTCWHGGGSGTADYEQWFGEMQKAGMNYGRLWMWPMAFGIEVLAEERLSYNQERAWRLDRTLDLAAQNGIRIMLCLDYHGIFQTEPDYWKGNNYWPRHAYNAANGGPCATQNEFFTNPDAKSLYKKRLRYLVGRYAAHPALMSWQFFNEINNVYKVLKPSDVVAWHDEMARWLKANDPYKHLVTTSFSGWQEHPEMWNLEGMDYIQRHMYFDGLETKAPPAEAIAKTARRDMRKFNKPMYIGECGVTWKGFGKELDPHFRGMKQSVWSGIMCGTAGTAMSWWWQSIHTGRLYRIWSALAGFLDGAGFGSAGWRPLEVAGAEQVSAYAMTDGATVLLWLVDKRYAYPNNATQPAEPLAGATVKLTLPEGENEVIWYDTEAGKNCGSERVSGGAISLKTPEFRADIAAKIRQVG